MIYQKQFTFVFIREDAYILTTTTTKKKKTIYLAYAHLSVCVYGCVLKKGK